MFMLCIRLNDKYGHLVSSSCRSSRLKYKSPLYHVIHTLFMAPFYLAGLSTEKQMVQLEMYTDFEEDQVKKLFFFCSFRSVVYNLYVYISVTSNYRRIF